MKLAAPVDSGLTPTPIRDLIGAEASLLRRHLLSTLESDDRAKADALLAQIHAGPHWVLCDCTGGIDPPVLHTRLNSQGHVALVRNTHRPPHRPGCVFAAGLSDLYENPPELRATADSILLSCLRLTATNSLFSHDKTKPTDRPNLWSALKAFPSAARSIRDTDGSLGDYFATSAQAIPRLCATMRKTHTPRAWLVIPTTAITRGEVIPGTPPGVDPTPITIRGPNERAYDADAASALSLTVLKLSRGTDGRYEPSYSVSYPILPAGNPIPAPTLAIRAGLIAARRACVEIRKLGIPVNATVIHPHGLSHTPTVHIRPAQPNLANLKVSFLAAEPLPGNPEFGHPYILNPLAIAALPGQNDYATQLARYLQLHMLGKPAPPPTWQPGRA